MGRTTIEFDHQPPLHIVDIAEPTATDCGRGLSRRLGQSMPAFDSHQISMLEDRARPVGHIVENARHKLSTAHPWPIPNRAYQTVRSRLPGVDGVRQTCDDVSLRPRFSGDVEDRLLHSHARRMRFPHHLCFELSPVVDDDAGTACHPT